MSTDPQAAPRRLPDRPSLRHLKDQAKDLFKTGGLHRSPTRSSRLRVSMGFASWPKLKAHVESFEEIGQLKHAIDTNDIVRVKTMMTRNPLGAGTPRGLHDRVRAGSIFAIFRLWMVLAGRTQKPQEPRPLQPPQFTNFVAQVRCFRRSKTALFGTGC